jgi:glycine oxidase
MTVDVAVVGGGVIGLAIAWRCARRGLRVRVYDPSPGQGASRASAGMLAPVSEAYFGEAELTRLLVASADRWPAFRAELETEAERLRAYQAGLGLPIEALRPGQLREREPLLSPRLRGGAYAAADRQVDPRRLVAALCAALDGTVEPRAVTDLSEVDAEVVVVAAGCGSAALTGLPVRPVKGQILRLRAPAGAPPGFRHVIRGYADGRSVYLVPRADGEVVVGATAEERRDSSVTAGGVLDLLRAAVDLVPELAEYELAEAAVGHRPGTPDNAPIVGWLEPDRTVVATGHFRHGVVLTPITADAVADLVCTGEVPSVLAPFGPSRFASSLVDAGRSGGTR